MSWQVLERTQHVDYRIPSSPRISSACRDFLSHLLVADPDQRLSTAAIMEHPWFCQGLPPGVKSLNDECLRLKVALLSRAVQCRPPGFAALPGLPGGRDWGGYRVFQAGRPDVAVLCCAAEPGAAAAHG